MGLVDRDSRGLLRTVAETVEKPKNMIFITCKVLISLIHIFKKKPEMDIFDSLASLLNVSNHCARMSGV